MAAAWQAWSDGTMNPLLIARDDGCATSLHREQFIETYRISDANNVTGRVVVEPQSHVKIQLLSWTESIQSARVQQLGGTAIHGVIPYVFHKQARPLGHLLFDHKGGFCDQFAGWV